MNDGIEKYGVVTDKGGNLDKTASGVDSCPQCGTGIEKHGSVLKCPKCGTKPFEGRTYGEGEGKSKG